MLNLYKVNKYKVLKKISEESYIFVFLLKADIEIKNMLSKQLKILSSILTILGICAFFAFQYFLQSDERGGFKEGTEQYNGYRYAQDNQLKSVDECSDGKNDPAMNFNPDFLQGCQHYFNQ
ncbi:hypothetical protein [Acinetobacter sp. SFB]|uniref:hypothetical protein n=1 Tax=Acinetobacter sp. SFB TaxID=1805634 RepID=UPI000B2D8FB9|nr:hypothetical protein [Acinetobacter sp. SFB]